jgi:hypothetical protein
MKIKVIAPPKNNIVSDTLCPWSVDCPPEGKR